MLFMKTSDRISQSEKLMSYPRVSGAIAPGLKAEVPGIEAACRLNSIGKNVFYTENLNSYEAEVSLSDEFLFDVLPRPDGQRKSRRDIKNTYVMHDLR